MAFGAPIGAETTWFYGNSVTAGASWLSWTKRKTASMVHILLIGSGGNGGLGVAGANSTAAGGGGGGSGAQTSVLIPAFLLPDSLFLSLAYGGGAIASYVSFERATTAQSLLAIANGGGNGGAAVGATPGAAGAAGGVATIAGMPRAGGGTIQLLVGQAGIIGGVAVAGASVAAPTTGLYVSGGAGGGGLPAAAAVGTAGGGFTGAGIWISQSGGTSAGASSTGTNGANGMEDYNGIWLPTPGCGGASGGGTTGGSGAGGVGGPGCGGGGSGGCITGQVVGAAGRGGSAICIITQW
jgi:hypothetical protein